MVLSMLHSSCLLDAGPVHNLILETTCVILFVSEKLAPVVICTSLCIMFFTVCLETFINQIISGLMFFNFIDVYIYHVFDKI